jgi:hypothetical protein
VLAAYGLPWGSSVLSAAETGWQLTLKDHLTMGLRAVAGTPTGGEQQRTTRLLPLTDRDAEELVQAAGVVRVPTDATVELVLRAARLIDDQPDIAGIDITLQSSMSSAAGAAIAVWTGRGRGAGDDPFVRRLPSRGQLDRMEKS